jgi:hypothetical protein
VLGVLTAHHGGRTLLAEENHMANADPIQALRELMQKRFVELATEMPLKSRRILKEILDEVVTQLAGLRDSVGVSQHPSSAPKKASTPGTAKARGSH